jgi:PIN domain nuclease of toxin-antitoxin system
VNLLLDTHILLWWLGDQPELANKARKLIADGHNLVFISAVVVWEIIIKKAIGKLEVPSDFRVVLQKQSFEFLDITSEHSFAVGDLPDYHRDPFDRMLIAQAKIEGLTLMTHDARLQEYDVPVLMV